MSAAGAARGSPEQAAGKPGKPTGSAALAEAIRAQVEHYFSDANLPTDTHLLQQISQDPQGCGGWAVCLAAHARGGGGSVHTDHTSGSACAVGRALHATHCLTACLCALSRGLHVVAGACMACPPRTVPIAHIAAFKRLKKLSRDVAVIADALRGSSMLTVDEAGTAVRRTAPLAAFDAHDISRRTVVAEHLPGQPTIGARAALLVGALQSEVQRGGGCMAAVWLLPVALVQYTRADDMQRCAVLVCPWCVGRVGHAAVQAVWRGADGAHLQPWQHRHAAAVARQGCGRHQPGGRAAGVCAGGVWMRGRLHKLRQQDQEPRQLVRG